MSGCAAAAQQGDFPGVAIVVIGGLQDEGKPAERRMADDPGKGRQADGSFADAGMAILVAGSGIEAVIQVDGPETGKADGLVKGGEDTVQIVHDIITAIPYMAGIQADTQVVGELYAIDDGRDFLEAAANLGSLAGHGFQQDGGGLVLLENGIQQAGDELDAPGGSLAHMASRVKVVEIPRRALQPPQVICHGFPGKYPQVFLGCAGIQGVGGMRHQRSDPLVLFKFQKGGQILFVNVLGPSAPGIPGEKGKHIRPQGQSPLGADGDAAVAGDALRALERQVVVRDDARPVPAAAEGQDLAGKHFYRPISDKAAAKYARQFPKLNLFTIDQAFGGWTQAGKTHFADGGQFDQIYTNK